jgi:hypothetical protein
LGRALFPADAGAAPPRRAPYVSAWWEYKPTPDWSFHFEIANVTRFVYDDKIFDYAGPRDTFPLVATEELSIKSQPRRYIQIRRTF